MIQLSDSGNERIVELCTEGCAAAAELQLPPNSLEVSCDGSFRFIHWSEAGCLWPQLHRLREQEWKSKLNVRKAGLRLVWEIERITRSTHPLQNGNHLVVCVGDQNRQRAGVVFRPGSFPALNLLLTFSIRVDGERCNVTGEDWPPLSLVLSENRGAQKSPFYTSLQSTKPPPPSPRPREEPLNASMVCDQTSPEAAGKIPPSS